MQSEVDPRAIKVIIQSRSEGPQPTGVLVGKVDEVIKPKGLLRRAIDYIIGEPLTYLVNWGRLYSLWPTHVETACCSVEIGASAGSRWDIERFGVLEAFGSLRQCDLMLVMGTVTRKLAPRLKLIWDQMPDPKFCIAMGACAISGGLYEQSYNVLQGVDKIIPVDVYIPGCPPPAPAVIDAIVKLQEKIRCMDLKGRVLSEAYLRFSPKWRFR
ncbi:MAG: NADH-quinone oxidoreductase subunit B [Nitrososphaerales archaeon]